MAAKRSTFTRFDKLSIPLMIRPDSTELCHSLIVLTSDRKTKRAIIFIDEYCPHKTFPRVAKNEIMVGMLNHKDVLFDLYTTNIN